MRVFVVALALVGAVVVLSAPGARGVEELHRRTVGVLEIGAGNSGLEDSQLYSITDWVRGTARRVLPEAMVMTRERVNQLKAMSPDVFERCSERGCELEWGRALGADVLVTGEAARFGRRLMVTSRMRDMAKGSFLEEETAAAEKPETLPVNVRKAAARLFGVLSSGVLVIEGRPEGSRVELRCAKGYERVFGLPGRLAVPRGRCGVRVSRDGYQTAEGQAVFERSLDVAGGATVSGSVSLKELPAASAAPAVLAGWARVGAGSYEIGSPSGESGRDDDERQHTVRLTHAFLLKTTEVTQGEWRSLMGSSPSYYGGCGADCPVERVSWWDSLAYCNALSAREGLESCYELSGCAGLPGGGCASGEVVCAGDYWCRSVRFRGLGCRGYRLPTESEWEVSARAGSSGGRHGALDGVAWYSGNSGDSPHPVGGKAPNGWGMYDMLGNVSEWCWDWYGKDYPGIVTDPAGPGSGPGRVVRGDSWISTAPYVRAAGRAGFAPGSRAFFLGLRPARSNP